MLEMSAGIGACAGLYRADFPNPFSVFGGSRPTQRAGQHLRRATLLSNVRRQLAERGFSAVTLRSVAENTHVSAQTVYNLVGDRKTMITKAVIEHILLQGQTAFARTGYPNPMFALVDLFWEGVALYPDYSRNANLTYFPPDRPLFEPINRCANTLARKALQMMEENGQTRPHDRHALAARIMSLQGVMILDAVSSPGDVRELRDSLISGVAMMLVTAVTPRHAAEIEAWIASGARFDASEEASSLAPCERADGDGSSGDDQIKR